MIIRKDLKEQALQGSTKPLVECLALLKTDAARNPGQRPPVFAEFVSWGLFSTILSIERAPPDTQVDYAFWCQRLRLLPVSLTVQIILAGTTISAADDKELHTEIWPGVSRWRNFISQLDDDACQSMDSSVLKLVADIARDILECLDRFPRAHILSEDPEGTRCLFLSTARLAFCCPEALWCHDMLKPACRFLEQSSKMSHRLPPELASQIAGLSVMAISQLVEERGAPGIVFLDRFVLLRLLAANDRSLVRELSSQRYAHWLMAWVKSATQPTLPTAIIEPTASMINHILFLFQQMILWVGTPVASEILASEFLSVVSSYGFHRLMEWDALHGERDADHDMIGIKDHTRRILQIMQTLLVFQSFIKDIRSPVTAFKRSRTYKENLHSQDVRAFLELVALRRSMRQNYTRRCGNDACDGNPQGRGRMCYVCSYCNYTLYCSPTCQRVDWEAAAGHRCICTPAAEGTTVAQRQDDAFIRNELVLPLLKQNATRLREQVSRVNGDYDVVLDFLEDGGCGVLKFEGGKTGRRRQLKVGQRWIVTRVATADGLEGQRVPLLILNLTVAGELRVTEAGKPHRMVIL